MFSQTKRSALRADVRESGRLNVLDESQMARRRLALRRKIERFREAQAIHMPNLAQYVAEGTIEVDPSAWRTCEDLPLHLPSSLDNDTRITICTATLINTEHELRFARLAESLNELRQHLRSRIFANLFKIKNVTGQRHNTRARQWQKTINGRVLTAKWCYRRARSAFLGLRGSGDWERQYRVLLDDDVRAFNERALTLEEQRERADARRASGLLAEEVLAAPLDQGLETGEGRRHISWIWFTNGGFRASEVDDPNALHAGKTFASFSRS